MIYYHYCYHEKVYKKIKRCHQNNFLLQKRASLYLDHKQNEYHVADVIRLKRPDHRAVQPLGGRNDSRSQWWTHFPHLSSGLHLQNRMPLKEICWKFLAGNRIELVLGNLRVVQAENVQNRTQISHATSSRHRCGNMWGRFRSQWCNLLLRTQ